ncbi:hypothetical protein AVEN_49847-1 [Araneus ventricosus]|uniref:Uncharacterized protein n=1 Tax=Araneus ventricosus TaxID=182803 RepID=A0A4Y2PZL1_ARAVE|nr:hypothetical protein AVEN_49847-1 [Araneus ventricosus]
MKRRPRTLLLPDRGNTPSTEESQLALFRAYAEGYPPTGPEPKTKHRRDVDRRLFTPVPNIRNSSRTTPKFGRSIVHKERNNFSPIKFTQAPETS